MDIKDKELLLRDLSARLRYGVKILIENDNEELPFRTDKAYVNTMDEDHWSYFKFDRITITPYLRPMSSMSIEERREWEEYKDYVVESCDELINERIADLYDWLLAHHFDFRRLIEKGLALEAPEGMYNIK